MIVLISFKGLPIFEPRDGGAGSSNDGNVARRIFRDHAELVSEICEVPLEFVKGVYVVWISLASGLPICPVKFANYCQNLKKIYVENVKWYPLNATFHRIFDHGHEIIRLFPPTITSGMLSEEAVEATNKDLKSFQIKHSRQNRPDLRSLDTFNRQMDRSDPQVCTWFLN